MNKKVEDLARLALYGNFPDKSGTVDRRVLWCLVWRWQGKGSDWCEYPVGNLATASGTYRHRTEESLERLKERGLISERKATDSTGTSPTTYIDSKCKKVHYVKAWKAKELPKSEAVDHLPELPADIFSSHKQDWRWPTYELWLSDDYSGKHSQIYALQQAGVTSATDIARCIGISRPNVYKYSRELKVLEDMPNEELGSVLFDGWDRREKVQEEVSENWQRYEAFEKAPKKPPQAKKPKAKAANSKPAQQAPVAPSLNNGSGGIAVLRVPEDLLKDLEEMTGTPTQILADPEDFGVLVGYKLPENATLRTGIRFGPAYVPTTYKAGDPVNSLRVADAPARLLEEIAIVRPVAMDEPDF